MLAMVTITGLDHIQPLVAVFGLYSILLRRRWSQPFISISGGLIGMLSISTGSSKLTVINTVKLPADR